MIYIDSQSWMNEYKQEDLDTRADKARSIPLLLTDGNAWMNVSINVNQQSFEVAHKAHQFILPR